MRTIPSVSVRATNVNTGGNATDMSSQDEMDGGKQITGLSSHTTATTFRSFQKKRTVRNPAYIEFIRSLGCSVCGKQGVDPHHCNPDGHGAKGMKTDDTRCIPLCHFHHHELHTIGKKSFAEKHDIQYEEVITYLNAYWERYK